MFDSKKLISASAFALLAAGTALAPAASAQGVTLPSWESEDGENYIKFRGRVLFDMADIDWSSPFTAAPTDSEEFRTARLGLQAEFGEAKIVAEFDFSGDDVSPNDVYLNYSFDFGSVRVGNFKTMNSLDELTSGRHVTFMERGISTDLFALDRRIGISYTWSGNGFLASVGAFGGRMDNNFRFAERDGTDALAARLVYAGETEDTLYHIGASWRHLNYDGGTRVRSRPQAHLANRFQAADYRTGSAAGEADSSTYTNVEFAFVRGAFHGHAEAARLDMDGPAGSPAFNSLFVQGGWIITGESRPYKRSSGTFDRIVAERPITSGGPGAWEVAARYDITDMGDANLGEFRSTTFGVNWYPVKHVRITGNYVTSELDAPTFTEESDTWQMRLQFDF